MRVCNVCRQAKPIEEFAKSNQAKDGRHPWCKPCKSLATRAWYAKNKDARREANRNIHLKRTYGITAEQYKQMLERQGGVCALCSRPPRRYRLSIDHDHLTKRVRALLCNHCNRRRVSDHTIDTARQLVAYLEHHTE